MRRATKHRLPLLATCAAMLALLLSAAGSAAASTAASRRHRAPAVRSLPTISGKVKVGDVLIAHPGRWARAERFVYRWERCNRKGKYCRVIHRSKRGSRKYRVTSADLGHRLRVIVTAWNAWGHTSVGSRETGVIARRHRKGTPPSQPSPSPSGGGTPPGGGTVDYFATVPSSEVGSPPAGIPRSDAFCASQVQPAAEVRPQNTTANNTVPSDPSSIQWNPGLDSWTGFVEDRNMVTGDYKGTTDEILQWVSCKWGIDVNLVRADAWVESNWIQSTIGDTCGGNGSNGEGSYGILQVKNEDCNGNSVGGGYPYTEDDTALDADYWGARLRACYDGAFYQSGSNWLYNGQTIAQVIAQNGQAYALWGCIGSWYSGNWYDSGAQGYISKVQSAYASKPWLSLGS